MNQSLAMQMKFAKSEADVKNYFENHFQLNDAHIGWVDLVAPHIFFEVKQRDADIYQMLAQLILTIHRHQNDFEFLPDYIGGFDSYKCAIIEFDELYQRIQTYSDVNWNQTPSMVDDKTVLLVKKFVDEIGTLRVYSFDRDEAELKSALQKITTGRAIDGRVLQKQINFGNYVSVFMKFANELADNIEIPTGAKNDGIMLSDFYLADLLSDANTPIQGLDRLKVLRDGAQYRSNKKMDKRLFIEVFKIKDLTRHEQFWARYKRPPKREYWDKIIERRDLLVPRVVRERKGAFFTPRVWVARATEYMADVFGPDFADMYVWDPAAGTGNLLQYLPQDKRNIFASTLDEPDVQIMKQTQITMDNNIFQFNFLNDPFIPESAAGKIPNRLYEILGNPEERKKLIIFMNPPYAEGDTVSENSDKRTGVANTWMHDKYKNVIGKSARELFAQFLIRIYLELPGSNIGEFSTLKTLQSGNFADFRNVFHAKLEKCFVVPADTFDNVKGQFPIGFKIWDTSINEKFQSIVADVFNKDNEFIGNKKFQNYDGLKYINDWMRSFDDDKDKIGVLGYVGNDFQNWKYVFISTNGRGHHQTIVTKNNFLELCIYFAVRLSIEPTWLNDRDQFLYPNVRTEYNYSPVVGIPDEYSRYVVNNPSLLETRQEFEYDSDFEFKYNCLIYTLFHSQNRISSAAGTNHWIPFTESAVGSNRAFDSDFMYRFLSIRGIPEILSPHARAVYNAGLELWRYYFSKNPENHNASFYDIKEFFKGRTANGKMNAKSDDAEFSRLESELATAMRALAEQIEPRVYDYGFLRR